MKKSILFFISMALIFGTVSYVDAAEFVGSDACAKCHMSKYNDFVVSGHPWKIRKAADAKVVGIPLPEGYAWDDISYVIGGAHAKIRYMDKKGYIITMTGPNKDKAGKNQYNMATGKWVDYEAGKVAKYDCGPCHTTGYNKEGNQDGLEGVVGTWKFAGIQCEACHGPGGMHAKEPSKANIKIDKSAAECGKCHVRGSKDKIPAAGGFIRHHEQYNEHLASPHKGLDCVVCHDSHKRAKFSIIKDCKSCHDKADKDFTGSKKDKIGMSCLDCHMPRALRTAVAFSKYEADVRSHAVKINIDPKAEMFYKEAKLDKEGKQVLDKEGKPQMDEFARGYLTVEFACLYCHKDKDKDWAAAKAKGIHSYGK